MARIAGAALWVLAAGCAAHGLGGGRRHAGELQACYEAALVADPELAGRLEVVWSVRDRRVASGPVVVANDTGSDTLASCVQARIAAWRFPKGVEGEVSFPFLFQPEGSAR